MLITLISGFIVLSIFLAFAVSYVCHDEISTPKKAFIYYVWLISFMPIIIIPLEVVELYGTTQDKMTSLERDNLKAVWKFYYWNNFINGWILVPIFTGALCRGHFGIRQRVVDAVVYNITFYSISLGIVAVAAMITISRADITFADFAINGLAIYNSMFANKLLRCFHGLFELQSLQASPALSEFECSPKS